MRYRVLWIDSAGNGRFTTVEASSGEAAAWQVAIDACSEAAKFEGIEQIDTSGGLR
jgi:hypothetical protein